MAASSPGSLKLNIDAAWKPGIPKTGIGAILRNSEGFLVGFAVQSTDIDFDTPLAELLAIKLAFILRPQLPVRR